MAITSAEIHNQSFSIDRKGYDVDEVDVFLEHVADEIDGLNQQIASLQSQVSEDTFAGFDRPATFEDEAFDDPEPEPGDEQEDQFAASDDPAILAEKDAAMERFAAHETDILVATVVIEVGINVPNACVMIIENAERFGLAQLHQLRGRVGRGKEQSYCFLITDPKSELGKERAKVIEETNDGFVIAEKDLRMRGPGDFFGTRQHGLPALGMADLVKHIGILNGLRPAVKEMLQADPHLRKPENALVAEGVQKLFGSFENLGL